MFIDSDPDSKSLGLLPTSSSSSSPCPHNESDRLYNDWPFPLTFFVMLRLRVLSFIAAVLLLLSEGTVLTCSASISSEVIQCNSRIVIPICNSWYGNATTASNVFCFLVVYYVRARDLSVRFFRLTFIREHRLFVSFASSGRLLAGCFVLVAPYWGWNNIVKMIHPDCYFYVGLLRVLWRIGKCFGGKECATLFHGNTRCKNKKAYTKQWNYTIIWTDS